MDILILKQDDEFYLCLKGDKQALINLGQHEPLVMAALEEAVKEHGDYCKHCDIFAVYDGCCMNCGTPA